MPVSSMASPQTRSRRSRPLVLLVDDNPTQLDLYAMMLEHDMDVVTAPRARDGYAIACAEQPDAVVVDVLMPDMDGLELCELLRRNPATVTIPIVVLTADDAAFQRAQFARLDVVRDVLMKPCSGDRLMAAVRAALDHAED